MISMLSPKDAALWKKPYLFQHATICPFPLSVSWGISAAHWSVAYRHLVLKGHPVGIFKGLGTSPSRIIRLLFLAVSGSGIGTADSRLKV